MNVNSEINNHSNSLNQKIQARRMLLKGYLIKIIEIETGLKYRQVLSISQSLKKEGHKLNRQSRAFRSSATLIHNRATIRDASLLMQLYNNISDKTELNSVNITALDKAYSLYHSILKEINAKQTESSAKQTKSFDISGAWRLAQELRSDEAMMEECKACHCTYFSSIVQRTLVRCPFC